MRDGVTSAAGNELAQDIVALARAAIDQRLAVAQQAIEEEHRKRQLAAQRLDVELAAEAPHGDLERVRPAVGAQRNRLAVENQRGRNILQCGDNFRHARGDVVEIAREYAHLVRRTCAPGCARRRASIRGARCRARRAPRRRPRRAAPASAAPAASAGSRTAPSALRLPPAPRAPPARCRPRRSRRAALPPRAGPPPRRRASSITPSSAPCRSSPTMSRSRKSCSSAVAFRTAPSTVPSGLRQRPCP